ncbi:uncharacterized protein B0H64DRAFT_83681 [Chaetomium fimeti]|uniref:Uncharacterized protein n=1 Tax=Chaetomium fimeti TaxID=1854472 RepID=A0AAE0LVX8_9PEZI|nr:hypothetical protein B0H64DRAFT_83681 [Chaetomium fimeti]
MKKVSSVNTVYLGFQVILFFYFYSRGWLTCALGVRLLLLMVAHGVAAPENEPISIACVASCVNPCNRNPGGLIALGDNSLTPIWKVLFIDPSVALPASSRVRQQISRRCELSHVPHPRCIYPSLLPDSATSKPSRK